MADFIIGDWVGIANWNTHGRVVGVQRNAVTGKVSYYKIKMSDEHIDQAKFVEADRVVEWKDWRTCVCGGDSLRDPLHAYFCSKADK